MVAELAAKRKLIKYSNLPSNLIFQPIAAENLGAFSSSSSDFISALGHKNSCVSDKERETSNLFQRLSRRHLRSPGRSGPIAIAALFLLLLTFGNYTPKDIKNLQREKKGQKRKAGSLREGENERESRVSFRKSTPLKWSVTVDSKT